MISLPPTVRVLLCTRPTDMRKGFDGLRALVEEAFEEDPLSGHLFVFRNRRGDRLKILWWDRDGLAIWYKRLEVGTFPWPAANVDSGKVEVRPAELAMLLDGVDPTSVQAWSSVREIGVTRFEDRDGIGEIPRFVGFE